MPLRSKAQERFLQGIAHGMKPRGEGPSQAQAKKFLADSAGQDTSRLPEKVRQKSQHGALRSM